jgi:hypothetical protein
LLGTKDYVVVVDSNHENQQAHDEKHKDHFIMDPNHDIDLSYQ